MRGDRSDVEVHATDGPTARGGGPARRSRRGRAQIYDTSISAYMDFNPSVTGSTGSVTGTASTVLTGATGCTHMASIAIRSSRPADACGLGPSARFVLSFGAGKGARRRSIKLTCTVIDVVLVLEILILLLLAI